MLNSDDVKQIKEIFEPVDKKITAIQSDVSGLKSDVSGLHKDMKTVKKDVAQTRKDVKVIISYFDSEYVELRKRIEKIEDFLRLTSKN